MPTLKVTIDDQPPAFVQFPPGAKQVTLATLSPDAHRYRIEVIGGNQIKPDGWQRHDVSDQDRQPRVRRRRHACRRRPCGPTGRCSWATATFRPILASRPPGRTTNMSITRCRGPATWRLRSIASLARSASVRPAGSIRGRGAIRRCPTGGITTRPASRAIFLCSPTMCGWRWGERSQRRAGQADRGDRAPGCAGASGVSRRPRFFASSPFTARTAPAVTAAVLPPLPPTAGRPAHPPDRLGPRARIGHPLPHAASHLADRRRPAPPLSVPRADRRRHCKAVAGGVDAAWAHGAA